MNLKSNKLFGPTVGFLSEMIDLVWATYCSERNLSILLFLLVSNNYYEHKCIFLFAVQKKLQHEFTFYDEFCYLYTKRNSTDFEIF